MDNLNLCSSCQRDKDGSCPEKGCFGIPDQWYIPRIKYSQTIGIGGRLLLIFRWVITCIVAIGLIPTWVIGIGWYLLVAFAMFGYAISRWIFTGTALEETMSDNMWDSATTLVFKFYGWIVRKVSPINENGELK